MAHNPLSEMIAAFAAGCMDKDNFVQFKDYFSAGGELPESELGDLQNIVSMVPVILDIENPDPAIKDNIAKKLISMQDEIKTRIREERKKTVQTFGGAGTITAAKTIAGKTFLSETRSEKKNTLSFGKGEKKTSFTKIENLTAELDKVKTSHFTKVGSVLPENPQALFNNQSPSTVQPSQSEERSSGSLSGWLAIILVLLLFTILGYYTYSSVSELNNKIEDLDREVTSLRSELSTSNNFISNYISLIEFFNNKDVTVINLNPLEITEKGSARLLLAFDQKEGLIQFKNVKPLQPNQGYQVWVVSKNQSYSIGVYTPNQNEYLRLSAFPFLPKEQIDKIKITIESNTGSPTPSIESYLEGSINPRR